MAFAALEGQGIRKEVERKEGLEAYEMLDKYLNTVHWMRLLLQVQVQAWGKATIPGRL